MCPVVVSPGVQGISGGELRAAGQPQCGQWPAPSRFFSAIATTACVRYGKRIGSPPGDFGERRQVGLVNWNAPRYKPPPPIALGLRPDSQSAVRRAQRLLRREACRQSRLYLALTFFFGLESARTVPPVPRPPEAAGAAVEEIAKAASAATTASSGRRILGLDFATSCEVGKSSALSIAYGVS